MKKTLMWTLVGAAFGSGAFAQTVDHAALEQLFGEPVTTNATGSPQRESEVPASMEIIDAEEIRRSGARDLPALLRHVTGIDVLQTSLDYADVGVRGYNQAFSPRLLVLVDNRQVYADYYGFTPWTSIPVELAEIRQIEIVRGPSSALFGFNAVGGVINIITYAPRDDIPNSAAATIGTQGLTQLSAMTGWKIGETAGVRIAVGRQESDDFSTPESAFDVGSRRGNHREALHIDGGVNIVDGVRADFEGTYSDAAHPERGPLYLTDFLTYETHSVQARVAAETGLGLIEGVIYSNDIHAEVFPDVQVSPFLAFDNEVTVAQLESVSKIGRSHTLRLSFERRHNSMQTTPIEGADVFYDVTSFGGMWEWKITDALTLTNALRSDDLRLGRSGSVPPGYSLQNSDWDRSIAETSFNSGVVWRLTDADVLRFMVGRGAQLPSLFNLGGVLIPVPPSFYVSGSPALGATIVTNYEVSWSRALASLGATLRVSAFRGKTVGIVATVGGSNIAAGLAGLPVNVGDSRESGIEVAIEGKFAGGWRWGASYSPLRIDDDFRPGYTVATTLTDFEHTTPRHTLDANVGWARGPWEVDAYLRYRSSFDGIENALGGTAGVLLPVSGYVSVDARLGYRVNDKVTLAVAGQGLTQAEQVQTAGTPAVERRVLATVQFAF
ncbi:MAG: TonB-dependent receptor [Gammaproteobacteria bacterium]